MQLMFDFDKPATIFDVVKEEKEMTGKVIDKNPELDDLSLDDLAKIIIKETGIQFVKDKDRYTYINKKYKKKVSFGYGRFKYYELPNYKGDYHNERFISCDYSFNMGGDGSPIKTIKGAVEYFNNHKERLNKKEEN